MNEKKKREASMGWKQIIFVVIVFFLYIQINANHSLIMQTKTMLDQKGIRQVSDIQDSYRSSEYRVRFEERMIALFGNKVDDTNEELIRVNNRLNKRLNEAIKGVNYWVGVIEENRHNIKTHRHERHVNDKPVLLRTK